MDFFFFFYWTAELSLKENHHVIYAICHLQWDSRSKIENTTWYSFQKESFHPHVTGTPGFPYRGPKKAWLRSPYIMVVHDRRLRCVQLHHMEMAVEEMRRAGSEINKSSSQIIRLWMCRPVSGFAGWWPEAATDSADNLCRTCAFFTQVNVT